MSHQIRSRYKDTPAVVLSCHIYSDLNDRVLAKALTSKLESALQEMEVTIKDETGALQTGTLVGLKVIVNTSADAINGEYTDKITFVFQPKSQR